MALTRAEISRRYYANNKEKVAARHAKWWPEYYAKNREKIIARTMAWQENNPEKMRSKSNAWYAKNRTKVALNSERWRKANPARHLFRLAKGRAKRRGIEFNISISDIFVPDVCPHLGIELSTESSELDFRPSLDRKNPSKGYTKDNVMVISHRANRLKNNSSGDELLVLALSVLKMEGQL